ncbi:cysteine dioxygenase [Pseudonocardia pini]|uniref:cysteine dioxygenase n=1 Tax=Pseudonocardia pini TaxID=2758030 RepID=UPI0028AD52D8|nr:cysteine dioxygenase family protein [Pseudonocardia pini]
MRTHAPTPLSLTDLTDLTRRYADAVRRGEHSVHIDPVHRWSRRLVADDVVDVWLISWATDQAAELHDHAGSLGALTVVSGLLVEQRWVRGEGLRSRSIAAGRGAAFPLGHVHDVGNVEATPAVSVHAYSPPLTAMSYYDVAPGGFLRRTRTELTDEPEKVSA